jgi:hypothetical protein
MVDALRWAAALILVALSMLITFNNWRIPIGFLLWRTRNRSWTPILGGGVGCLGILCVPNESVQSYWWVPLLVDWGCIPGIALTVLVLLFRCVFLRDETGPTK